jgi:hypothetical protein
MGKLPTQYCKLESTVRINAGHPRGRAMYACDAHMGSVAKAVALDKKRAIVFLNDQGMPCMWGQGLPWLWEKDLR